MKTAIAFLTITPSDELKSFAKQCNEFYDTFIVVDDEKVKGDNELICIIKDEECIEHDFVNSNVADASHIRKNPMAWDKVLYLFCKLQKEYDFVWICEDDVFVPSVDSFLIMKKYTSYFDLVVANNFLKRDSTPDWHWQRIFSKIKPPYFYSMVCACGMSRLMLDCINYYVNENKELFYLEAMFNTIAMQNKLKVHTPIELATIVWQGNWTENEILQLPRNLFHPIKESHEELRIKLYELKKQGYKPNKPLPSFVIDRIERDKRK